ncbi:peptide chain release factor 2 [Desulfitibacter alkalitolerans]|uniref:peptide chain release factor 2 n=1 Tax=Desulfitibacter alkalitolerans TaxID=264641 RepID=UPI0012EB9CF6|nr:peptide chain release factor 2 [Desulfitibacter alkalitolerans]
MLAEIRWRMNKVVKDFDELRASLDLESKRISVQKLEAMINQPGFWDDQQKAQEIMKQLNGLKAKIHQIQEMETYLEEVEIMCQLSEEENDTDLLKEIEAKLVSIEDEVEKLQIEVLLSEPYDKNNAIISLHPGAGGTESQDWAEMLYRMYMRWAEKKGFVIEVLDFLPGDEAGIKSVTFSVAGDNAYGYLKSEKGVHRLVRISPFDASGRRHTSFASVDVIPEVSDEEELKIDPVELKVDTYRAGGAGGQHVNKTDSAVRITHLPTGIVVQCQNERSQHANRLAAMKILTAKLFELKQRQKEEELVKIRGEQQDIGWGSQIRSYVFHPYSMIKDHRTDVEVGNVEKVMNGDLDIFISAYLHGLGSQK